MLLAAGQGQVAVVGELVAAGACLDARDERGRSALMEAVVEGDLGVVRALVAAGANTTLTDMQGCQATDLAGDNSNIISLLLSVQDITL